MNINSYKSMGVLNKKHLVSLQNYTEENIYEILFAAKEITARLAAGEKLTALKNKYIYLITKRGFSRSRIAFETAVSKLSGTSTVSTMHGSDIDSVLKDGLSLAAIAEYGVNAIMVSTEMSTDAETLEKNVSLPVINANSKSGPCEALAALLTVWEKKGRLSGLKVAVIGDAEEASDGFIYAFIKCGADVTAICPEGNRPQEKTLGYCAQYGDVIVTDDIKSGVADADVIYVSGKNSGEKFVLTEELLQTAKPDAIVLHVLPVPCENANLTEDVIKSRNFAALEQAVNLQRILTAALYLLVK
ncbi:MAG: hypothetical protein PUH90_06395 [Clostridia bacterium]|nr:hypothetical protein [Clostridia bacterium]MDY3723748.1 hypothetical protein [Christensenellaceae bacterium]